MKKPLLIACSLVFAAANVAHADEASDLKAKLEALQKQMNELKGHLEEVTEQMRNQKQAVAGPTAEQAKNFIQKKPGDDLTFTMGEGEVTLYGYLDVSVDYTTKGIKNKFGNGGSTDIPVGNVGYLPGLSTNLSYLGIRGKHPLPLKKDFNFVYQLEAQLDIAAAPGTTATNSNNGNTVKSGLFFRNTFIGFSDKVFGALKAGKTDAPYKTSTARMNPFSGQIGDYQIVMGNTGGDNRVEFGTRVNHAIWYESPNLNGFTLNALVSPGQNRATDDSLIPFGEPDCAGGNAPGSGALPPSCNDGSFGTAYSANLAYQTGPFYATVAYELHANVNRTSDLANLDPRDVGDETAAKIGIQYVFPTKTTVSAIYEQMRRSIDPALEFQNERTRNGWWLAVTQALTQKDNVSFGWAHVGRTPGDPGQHNTPGGLHPDNIANMFTANWKHSFDKSTTWYVAWALTLNHRDAHYDLGAGGRALTTDCHDGSTLAAIDVSSGAPAVTGTGPHCFAGGRLEGFSTGVSYRF